MQSREWDLSMGFQQACVCVSVHVGVWGLSQCLVSERVKLGVTVVCSPVWPHGWQLNGVSESVFVGNVRCLNADELREVLQHKGELEERIHYMYLISPFFVSLSFCLYSVASPLLKDHPLHSSSWSRWRPQACCHCWSGRKSWDPHHARPWGAGGDGYGKAGRGAGRIPACSAPAGPHLPEDSKRVRSTW